MANPPFPETDGVPPRVLAAIRAELRDDEELVWAGRPWLAAYFKHLLLVYPICLVFGAASLVGGWLLYAWAVRAGALWDAQILLAVAALVAWGGWLVVLPLLWPVRLARSWYALTTRRVILRRPGLLLLWLRTQSLDAARALVGGRVKVNLPDRSGDISWRPATGGRPVPPWRELRMEYVPQVEHVAELLGRTAAHGLDDASSDAVPPIAGNSA
jgi:hypothetical protein